MSFKLLANEQEAIISKSQGEVNKEGILLSVRKADKLAALGHCLRPYKLAAFGPISFPII